MSDRTDLDALRCLAKNALREDFTSFAETSKAIVEFDEASTPTVVLELIDRIRELEMDRRERDTW